MTAIQNKCLWRKGQSGNPAGKPKGAKDRRTSWRDKLGAELDAVLGVLVEAAKGGDVAAIALILSRACPPLRPQREPVALPALARATTLAEQARAILIAVAAGEASTDQAAELLAAIANAAQAVEVDELQKRITALEERTNEKT